MNVRVGAASMALVLASCAGYGPTGLQPGQTEAEVVQVMGQPTGRYALQGGVQRLEFARGPYGRHTYMIDLDPQGRVTQIDQVLEPNHFATVLPGHTRDDVLRTLGRPGERVGVMRGGQIWSWRYANNDCLWWQAQFDAQGVVVQAGYAFDRGCDHPQRVERPTMGRRG